jgi:hypothetical protein
MDDSLHFSYLSNNHRTIEISGTRFFFDTNFAGDPEKGYCGSTERRGTIVIPEELGLDLINDGYKSVKPTRPSQRLIDEGRMDEFIQQYLVPIKVAYRDRYGNPVEWPPKVFLTTEEGNETLLDEESIGTIDKIWISHVDVIVTKRYSDRGNTLYVRSMEVFQKTNDDPITARHRNRKNRDDDDDCIPFN